MIHDIVVEEDVSLPAAGDELPSDEADSTAAPGTQPSRRAMRRLRGRAMHSLPEAPGPLLSSAAGSGWGETARVA